MNPLVKSVGLAVAAGTLGVAAMVASSTASAQSAVEQVARVQTRNFAVRNMDCALCPVTVKKAMEDVEGVRSVEIDFAARTATVAFDPSIADADEIAAASTNAGYPASTITR